MKCADCGFDNPLLVKFCGGCGLPLGLTCSVCGFSNPPSFKFCGDCGASLGPANQRCITDRSIESGVSKRPALREPAERRHLSVMFCDLVGSTKMSGRLDPEDMTEVLDAFRRTCSKVILQHGGQVARFVGDGILVYFGYPKAHEDDARRAVRSGLKIIEEVRTLSTQIRAERGVALSVRVGVHTGLVLAGDLGSGDTLELMGVVGETPNIAARIQELSGPDTVLVSDSTQRLVEGLFQFDNLGPHKLNGVSRAITIFRVLKESGIPTRFEAVAKRGLTPLVGREEEVGLLLKRWEQTKNNEGQVVLLSGEAGIGKSRITQALLDRIVGSAHFRLRYYCSPLHISRALWPVIEQIERACKISRDDPVDNKVRKLTKFFQEEGVVENINQVLPRMAQLLSFELDSKDNQPDFGTESWRRNTLFFLANHIESLSLRKPVLLVFEDLHWADPTTLELIDILVDRVRTSPVMMILIFRSEFSPRWSEAPNSTFLTINRLDRAQISNLISLVSGHTALLPDVLDRIVERSDGVPLFAEEITKAAFESHTTSDDTNSTGAGSLRDIPETLQDSLNARLDRLGDAKVVAQIGAAIGRVFSHDLLAKVTDLDTDELDAACTALTGMGLVFQRGSSFDRAYFFKHSLLRDAAYASLLIRRRKELHHRIATAIEAHYPEVLVAEPETVAHHFTQADEFERAIRHWEAAGVHARARSANQESAANFETALSLIERLPDIRDKASIELRILLQLGGQLVAVRGNAAPEVEKTFSRAQELSAIVGNKVLLFRALRGLQTYHMVRGRLPQARELGDRLIDLARESGNVDDLLQSYRPHGLCLFYMGEMKQACEYLSHAIELYDPVQHESHRFSYGSDPLVLAKCNLAWAVWFLGKRDLAETYSSEAIRLGSHLGHFHSEAFALCIAASIQQAQGEPARVKELTERALGLSEKNRFPYWIAWSKVLQGWSIVMQGHQSNGIALIEEGLSEYKDTGAELMVPYFVALLAESKLADGQPEQTLSMLDQSIRFAEDNHIRFYEPELYRLRALFLHRCDQSSKSIEKSLVRASGLASAIGSPPLEDRVRGTYESLGLPIK